MLGLRWGLGLGCFGSWFRVGGRVRFRDMMFREKED